MNRRLRWSVECWMRPQVQNHVCQWTNLTSTQPYNTTRTRNTLNACYKRLKGMARNTLLSWGCLGLRRIACHPHSRIPLPPCAGFPAGKRTKLASWWKMAASNISMTSYLRLIGMLGSTFVVILRSTLTTFSWVTTKPDVNWELLPVKLRHKGSLKAQRSYFLQIGFKFGCQAGGDCEVDKKRLAWAGAMEWIAGNESGCYHMRLVCQTWCAGLPLAFHSRGSLATDFVSFVNLRYSCDDDLTSP